MNIKQKAVQQAIKMLEAAGAKYKIVDSDGAQYGDLTSVREKRGPGFRHLFRDAVDGMNVGDVIKVPCAKEQYDAMQGSIAAYCNYKFGSGNYITSRNKDGIEVLRVGGQ